MKKTGYFYDDRSFRLNVLRTTRNNGQDTLQDLNYYYDAVGNIVGEADHAQQIFYFANQEVEPVCNYTYFYLQNVGQRAITKDLITDYNSKMAPSILVPFERHRKVIGILNKTILENANPRQILAKDIFELRCVYGNQGIPNEALQELIEMNKIMYLEAFIK